MPTIVPSLWSGWPSAWWPPLWNQHVQTLTDTAWTCVDLNASVLSTMPPYLVNAAPTLGRRLADQPRAVAVHELGGVRQAAVLGLPGRRRSVRPRDVVLLDRLARHVPRDAAVDWSRSTWTTGSGVTGSAAPSSAPTSSSICATRARPPTRTATGHSRPAATKVVAGEILGRYIYGLAQSGGIPTSVLTHPDLLSPEQSAQLKADWIAARQSAIGEPAVLSGGIKWEPTQVNPKDMALVELTQMNDSRIAVLLGVPPFLVGLPSGGD